MWVEIIPAMLAAILTGRYIVPSKKARRMGKILVEKVNGTYRDPAYYDIEVRPPDTPADQVRKYRVRHVSEIPEPDRTQVVEGFRPRYEWLKRFLEDKDADDGPQ